MARIPQFNQGYKPLATQQLPGPTPLRFEADLGIEVGGVIQGLDNQLNRRLQDIQAVNSAAQEPLIPDGIGDAEALGEAAKGEAIGSAVSQIGGSLLALGEAQQRAQDQIDIQEAQTVFMGAEQEDRLFKEQNQNSPHLWLGNTESVISKANPFPLDRKVSPYANREISQMQQVWGERLRIGTDFDAKRRTFQIAEEQQRGSIMGAIEGVQTSRDVVPALRTVDSSVGYLVENQHVTPQEGALLRLKASDDIKLKAFQNLRGELDAIAADVDVKGEYQRGQSLIRDHQEIFADKDDRMELESIREEYEAKVGYRRAQLDIDEQVENLNVEGKAGYETLIGKLNERTPGGKFKHFKDLSPDQRKAETTRLYRDWNEMRVIGTEMMMEKVRAGGVTDVSQLSRNPHYGNLTASDRAGIQGVIEKGFDEQATSYASLMADIPDLVEAQRSGRDSEGLMMADWSVKVARLPAERQRALWNVMDDTIKTGPGMMPEVSGGFSDKGKSLMESGAFGKYRFKRSDIKEKTAPDGSKFYAVHTGKETDTITERTFLRGAFGTAESETVTGWREVRLSQDDIEADGNRMVTDQLGEGAAGDRLATVIQEFRAWEKEAPRTLEEGQQKWNELTGKAQQAHGLMKADEWETPEVPESTTFEESQLDAILDANLGGAPEPDPFAAPDGAQSSPGPLGPLGEPGDPNMTEGEELARQEGIAPPEIPGMESSAPEEGDTLAPLTAEGGDVQTYGEGSEPPEMLRATPTGQPADLTGWNVGMNPAANAAFPERIPEPQTAVEAVTQSQPEPQTENVPMKVSGKANFGGSSGWQGGKTRKEIEANLVTVKAPSGAKFRVNKTVAGNFAGFLQDLEATGYQVKADQSGGFNYRKTRGGSRLSQHAYGNAIDINWSENKAYWGGSDKISQVEGIAELAAKHGLTWGGLWHNKDTMHFEFNPANEVEARPAGLAPVKKPETMLADSAGSGDTIQPKKVTSYVPGLGGIEGGSLDRFGNRIVDRTTVEAYAEGKGDWITVAMDKNSPLQKKYLMSPDWPGAVFRVMDTGSAGDGQGEDWLDIAFKDRRRAKKHSANQPRQFKVITPEQAAEIRKDRDKFKSILATL